MGCDWSKALTQTGSYASPLLPPSNHQPGVKVQPPRGPFNSTLQYSFFGNQSSSSSSSFDSIHCRPLTSPSPCSPVTSLSRLVTVHQSVVAQSAVQTVRRLRRLSSLVSDPNCLPTSQPHLLLRKNSPLLYQAPIQHHRCLSAIMRDFGSPPSEPPPPLPPRPQEEFNATQLTADFERLLQTNRLNLLSTPARSRPVSPAPSRQLSNSSRPHSRPSSTHKPRTSSERPQVPPAYSSLRNHPKIASPPQDSSSLKFRNLLVTLSVGPTKYENPGLLDEALAVIPLDRIYEEAEDESQLLQAQAASIGPNVKAEWGYQDCVIRALLK